MIPFEIIEKYSNNHDELVELCREVFHEVYLRSNDDNRQILTKQLNAINQAISNLEKIGVPVSDGLMKDKEKLSKEIELMKESLTPLNQLINEISSLINKYKQKLDNASHQCSTAKPRRPRLKLPTTSREVLHKYIIEALEYYDNEAHRDDITSYIGEALNGKLLEGDLTPREKSGNLVWENNVHWELSNLKSRGILKAGSGKGRWALADS